MKKILMIIITSILLIVSNSPVYSLGYDDLGDYRSFGQYYYSTGYSVVTISILCFQFGMIIRGFPPGDIYYFYGQEDIPGMAKRSNEININNNNISSDDNIYVDVYDVSNVANPISTKHTIVKGDIGNNLQNLKLNLEKGRLYIVVFRDKAGAVLDVKKVVIAN